MIIYVSIWLDHGTQLFGQVKGSSSTGSPSPDVAVKVLFGYD